MIVLLVRLAGGRCSDETGVQQDRITRHVNTRLEAGFRLMRTWRDAESSSKKRGGPASQRSHPKPSPTQQPYKSWRTPPIVRILQYHSSVVRQVRAERPHSLWVLWTLPPDLVAFDEGTNAQKAGATFAVFFHSNGSRFTADICLSGSRNFIWKSN